MSLVVPSPNPGFTRIAETTTSSFLSTGSADDATLLLWDLTRAQPPVPTSRSAPQPAKPVSMPAVAYTAPSEVNAVAWWSAGEWISIGCGRTVRTLRCGSRSLPLFPPEARIGKGSSFLTLSLCASAGACRPWFCYGVRSFGSVGYEQREVPAAPLLFVLVMWTTGRLLRGIQTLILQSRGVTTSARRGFGVAPDRLLHCRTACYSHESSVRCSLASLPLASNPPSVWCWRSRGTSSRSLTFTFLPTIAR